MVTPHEKGSPVSTNPIASTFAWTCGHGKLDSMLKIELFAEVLRVKGAFVFSISMAL